MTRAMNAEIKTLIKHLIDYPKRKVIEWEFCDAEWTSNKVSQKLPAHYLLVQNHVMQAHKYESKESSKAERKPEQAHKREVIQANQKPQNLMQASKVQQEGIKANQKSKPQNVMQASKVQQEEIKANQKPKPVNLMEASKVQQEGNKANQKPKLHKCETCWKSFVTERSLLTHIKMHLGYKVEPKAKFKYRSIRDVKPFDCIKCSKCFRTEETLKKHMHKTHDGDNVFKCEFCGESDRNFSRKTRLLEHMSQHRVL